MNPEEKRQALLEKAGLEQAVYRERLLALPPEELLGQARQFAIREDIIAALEYMELEEPRLDMLLESEDILGKLYQEYAGGPVLLDGLEGVISAYAEELLEQIPVEETIQPEPVLTLEQKAQAIQDFIKEHWMEPAGQSMCARRMSLREGDGAGLEALYLETRGAPEGREPFPPVYRETLAYAAAHGEKARWQASQRLNRACRDALDTFIQESYYDSRLHMEGFPAVSARFGPERTAWVLAGTIRSQPWDRRYSPGNRQWAQGAPAWEGKDDCRLSSHPGLVDLLASQVRLLERQREQASPLQGQER